MLCLKLLETKEDRDIVVTIGMGYFVVTTVFIFNQTIFTGYLVSFDRPQTPVQARAQTYTG